MSKIFVFAIGGTGSRVLKSLAMELAAGVVPTDSLTGEPYDIVPIIIDPHVGNKDVDECKNILADYRKIRQDIYGGSVKTEGFYATRLMTLKEVGTSDDTELNLVDEFFYPISDITCDTFENYVGLSDSNVNDNVKKFTKMLFSSEELKTPMEHGFYGQPNLGTVALGAFKDSDYYSVLRKCYKEGDKLFFIGSIFGGTGAAGLPMLISSVRQNTEINESFAKAPIGALVVMPYFSIEENEDSKIKQSDFTLKIKTALRYYEKDLDPYVNNLYYLADDDKDNRPIKNDKGDGGQQDNIAHIAEVIGALALVNFASANFDSANTAKTDSDQRVVAANPKKLQFTVKNLDHDGQVDFTKFDKETNNLIMKPMMKYRIYDRFVFDGLLGRNLTDSFAKGRLDDASVTKEMVSFSNYYRQWLYELADDHNKHTFQPFKLDKDSGDKNFSDEFSGIVTRKKTLGRHTVDESDIKSCLNNIYKECNSQGTPYLFEVLNHSKSISTILEKYEIKNYVN